MLTNYAAKKLQDHLLRIASFSMPAQIWLGAHTGNPTVAGLLDDEVPTSGTAYGRQNITGLISATELSSGTAALNALVSFAVATADWDDIAYLSINDAETAGNMLAFTPLSEVIPILTGGTLAFVPGQIAFRMR